MSIAPPDSTTTDRLEYFPVQDNEIRLVSDRVVADQGTYWFLLLTSAKTWIEDSMHASSITKAEMNFRTGEEYRHLMAAVLRRNQVDQETVDAVRTQLKKDGLQIVSEYQVLPIPRDQV